MDCPKFRNAFQNFIREVCESQGESDVYESFWNSDPSSPLTKLLQIIQNGPEILKELSTLSTQSDLSKCLPDWFTLKSWIFRVVVEPYKEACWAQNQKLKFDERIFEGILNQVIADLKLSVTPFVVFIMPLLNIKILAETIDLGGGVKIRQLSSSETEDLQKPYSQFIRGSLRGDELNSLQCLIEVRSSSPHPIKAASKIWEFENLLMEETYRTANKLFSALRLLTDRYVYIAFTRAESRGPFWCRPTSGSQPSHRLPDPNPVILNEAGVDQLRKLWNRLHPNPQPKQADLALRRWAGAADRSSDEDKLVDYWIGLEAIFAPDSKQELKFRGSLRIAAFLGRTPDEREAMYKSMKDSYDWRSAIVHGDSKKGDLPKVVAKTRSNLRNSILQILEYDEPFKPDDIEVQLLRTSASINKETSDIEST